MSDNTNVNANAAADDGTKNTEPKEINFDELVEKNSQNFEKWITSSKVAEKIIAPIKDRAVTQAVKTYEANHLEPALREQEAKIRAEYNKAETPLEKQVKQMAEELNRSKAEGARSKAIADAANYAQTIKLDFGGKVKIDELVQGDSDKTIDLLSRIKDVLGDYFEQGKKSFMKDNTYTPGSGDTSGVPYDGDPKKYASAIKAGKAVYDQAIMDKINEFVFGKKK